MKFIESRSPIKSIALTLTKPRQQHSEHHSVWRRLQHVWQRLLHQLKTEELEFRVWSTRDRTGKTWWSADNSRTGKSIRKVSEDQIRRWIEKQQKS